MNKKLYVAKDSDGTVCLYTKRPVRRNYETGHYEYDPDGGQYTDISDLEPGEVRVIQFI